MRSPDRSDSSLSARDTLKAALQAAKNQLSVIAEHPLLEAEILLSHVLQKPRTYLHAWPENSISPHHASRLSDYVRRRQNREPLAYIIGRREFWSLELSVTPDTLIPRPETELLVERVLESMPEDDPGIKVADLGTGSGAIGLALAHERPAWQIYATDASESALSIAGKNAQQLGLENVYFSCGNWCTALPRADFDVIVSNPPYIGETEWAAYADNLRYEPRNALVSGGDGLDAIRIIIHSAKDYLRPEGYVLVEHGFLQGASVRRLFAASRYSHIHSVRDLSGQERITIAQYHP